MKTTLSRIEREIENSIRACILMGYDMGKKQSKTPFKYTCDTEKGEKYFIKIRHQILALLKEIVGELPKMKEYPPNLKQEIWGGEGGLPSTKIESPDVFGIKYVDGYNSALDEVKTILQNKIEEIKS